MTPPILVTGGTGTLGGHVVALLRTAGHDGANLSRGGAEFGLRTWDEFLAERASA
jgi:uncharacterized protein YbjT (DUF2867 family)